MKFKPSPLQKAIYDWVEFGEGSLIIEAVAGSGKTTTIVNVMDLISDTSNVMFLAFNKSIAEELATKTPKFVQVKTLNAAGARALGMFVGKFPKVNANKTRDIIRDMRIDDYTAEIARLVSLAKSYGIVPIKFKGATGVTRDTLDIWHELNDKFDIDVPASSMSYVISIVREVLTAGLYDKKVIDFDDQLYMPVVLGASFQRNDWVFVDEAQDVSPIQRAMLRKLLKPSGRLVAVGDPCQAIYGFRGADSASLGNIALEFDAITMPLSISYRCPKKVVEHAQTVVSHIEASDTAPEGSVETWDAFDGSEFNGDTDMIICRNTAPLIKLAYGLITKRIGAVVLGRDIGAGLVKLIDRLKPKGVEGEHGLIVKLENWVRSETQKLLTQDKEDRIQGVEDKAASLMAFVEGSGATTIPKLKDDIAALFGNSYGNTVTLCTVHKSKGLEAKRVFVLNQDLMPSPFARQEWQKEQERNLQYVAFTRAQESLIFIQDTGLADSKAAALNEALK